MLGDEFFFQRIDPMLIPEIFQTPFSNNIIKRRENKVQDLCERRGGRPGLAVLTSLLVSVDVKLY